MPVDREKGTITKRRLPTHETRAREMIRNDGAEVKTFAPLKRVRAKSTIGFYNVEGFCELKFSEDRKKVTLRSVVSDEEQESFLVEFNKTYNAQDFFYTMEVRAVEFGSSYKRTELPLIFEKEN